MFTYSQKAMDHFKNPRNVGALENADAVGEVGSLVCGHMLRLMFNIDEEGRITEAKFQAFGCASAIAACSALTEMLPGWTVGEAEKLTKDDVVRYLDGLPAQREFCSDICIEALQLAIRDWKTKVNTPVEPPPTLVLDCRKMACPLNYVKTKIQLDQMPPGERLCVLLGAEGARNVPNSARQEGHEVVEVTQQEDHWRVIISRKKIPFV